MRFFKYLRGYIFFVFLISIFGGCSFKQQPNFSKKMTIVFKTPNIKIYDQGFVQYYDDFVRLQVFNAGIIIFDLKIYDDKICKNIFACFDSSEFNKKFLNENYDDDFLYKLFNKKNVYYKNKKDKILIKILN